MWLLAATVAGVALGAPDARGSAAAILAALAKKPDAARVASDSIEKGNDAFTMVKVPGTLSESIVTPLTEALNTTRLPFVTLALDSAFPIWP